jgi:small-conductance mechanosensitive channel
LWVGLQPDGFPPRKREQMVIVRLLLVLGLATIGVAFVLYLVTRDKRYLRFVVQVAKVVLVALAGVFAFFLIERVLIML